MNKELNRELLKFFARVQLALTTLVKSVGRRVEATAKVAAQGNVKYGFRKDGEPRKKPGRKSGEAWHGRTKKAAKKTVAAKKTAAKKTSEKSSKPSKPSKAAKKGARR